MKRNNLMVKVYRNDSETGEQKLIRVYPCSHIFTTTESSMPKAMFIDLDGSQYAMDIDCSSWCNEYFEITVI